MENQEVPLNGNSPSGNPQTSKNVWAVVFIISGLFELLLPTVLLFFVLPNLQRLYNNLNVSSNIGQTYLILGILSIFALAQIGLGIALKRNALSENIHKRLQTIGIATFIIGGLSFFLLPGIAIISVISPIYSLTQQIAKETSVSVTQTPSPIPNQTTNWKTYTNQQLGFSVDYPQEWKIREFSRKYAYIGKSTSNGIGFSPNDPSGINNTSDIINIEVEQIKDGMTVDSFINNYLCDSPGVCASAEKATQIIISGIPAKKVINPPAPIQSQIAAVIKGNNIYTINVILGISFEKLYSIEQKQKIYNQFLTTFKFTDQNQTTDTANWKTYINTKYSYQIQYPGNLFINCPIQGEEDMLYLFDGSDPKKQCYAGEAPTRVSIMPIQKVVPPSEIPSCVSYAKEMISVGGIPAVKYTSVLAKDISHCSPMIGYENNHVYIFLQHNNTWLEMFFYIANNDEVKNQILSTFKFTDQK